MRPVLIDINASLSPRPTAEDSGRCRCARLLATLPLINLVTGLIVAALTSTAAAAPTSASTC